MIVWKNVAFGVLMALLGLAAVAYARAMRRWMGRLREVSDESSTLEARREFAASPEYARLRRAVLLPIYAATLVVLALFLLERLG
jgi:hypothetical protein